MDDLCAILPDLASEEKHADLSEHIEYRQHHQDQVVERAQKILDRLKNDSHRCDLVKQCD